MKKPQYRTVNRRQMIREVAVSGAVLSSAGRVLAQSTSNPIVVENQKPGTTDWQLTYIRSRNYRSQMLEGFCSHTSIKAGETLDFFISADRSTDVVIDIFRTGYYGGKGGRFMQRLGPFSVSPQTTPPIAEHRLRQCEWERTARLVIPNDWLSGVYLGKLSCEAHRYQSYVIFIVRDDRQADLMFQCSDTTWQA